MVLKFKEKMLMFTHLTFIEIMQGRSVLLYYHFDNLNILVVHTHSLKNPFSNLSSFTNIANLSTSLKNLLLLCFSHLLFPCSWSKSYSRASSPSAYGEKTEFYLALWCGEYWAQFNVHTGWWWGSFTQHISFGPTMCLVPFGITLSLLSSCWYLKWKRQKN